MTPGGRDDEFDTVGQALGDTSWQAQADVEQDAREEREAQAFQAGVRAHDALPETDLGRDALHDSGEDEFRRGVFQ